VRKLIVGTAAGLAAVVGAQVVAWLAIGQVPDELNDLPSVPAPRTRQQVGHNLAHRGGGPTSGPPTARALEVLVEKFGAQVRVNYETGRTRLPAKAWLLRRDTGFHTAYVGSSNLSHAALVDGLEWNVWLSAVSTSHLLEKFRATFEPYWESREFEPYRPASDGKQPRAALVIASGAWQRGRRQSARIPVISRGRRGRMSSPAKVTTALVLPSAAVNSAS
jgi:hypothetical protein